MGLLARRDATRAERNAHDAAHSRLRQTRVANRQILPIREIDDGALLRSQPTQRSADVDVAGWVHRLHDREAAGTNLAFFSPNR